MQILNQADVVMAIGTRLGPFGKTRQYDFDFWPTGARFIQIDVNHRVLGLTQDVELAIWGGARETVRLIFEQLGTIDHEVCSNTTRDDRMSRVQRLKDAWARELQEWTNRGPAGELSPRRALRELQRTMPERASSRPTWATSCPPASSYLTFEQPRSFLAAMSWGNCGCAFPSGIGAKVAKPDRPVIVYVGDGAWGMSLGEVLTCVRQNIPVTVVVFNNGQWGAEKRNQMDFYAERYSPSC
jgi:sulfoacetaldehyde acetyltransferase